MNSGHSEIPRRLRLLVMTGHAVSSPTCQKVISAPNWITRAGPAELMTPKLDEPKLLPGSPRLVWLKALKKPPRNRSLARSESLKSRKREKSKLTRPGPRTIPTPALPNWNSAGCAKAAVLNHCWTVRPEDRVGSAVRLGLKPPAENAFTVFVCAVTVNGGPD